MKKLLLILIVGILLVGLVYPSITTDKEIIDKGEGVFEVWEKTGEINIPDLNIQISKLHENKEYLLKNENDYLIQQKELCMMYSEQDYFIEDMESQGINKKTYLSQQNELCMMHSEADYLIEFIQIDFEIIQLNNKIKETQ